MKTRTYNPIKPVKPGFQVLFYFQNDTVEFHLNCGIRNLSLKIKKIIGILDERPNYVKVINSKGQEIIIR
jgi:hypothetical protein